MNQLATDDLYAPWFVIEEIDEFFSGNTNRQICYQSDFGPVQISLNSVQTVPHTHRRRRMAYLMAAAPTLYAALWDLFQLLEQHEPSWYSSPHRDLAQRALLRAEPPDEDGEAT